MASDEHGARVDRYALVGCGSAKMVTSAPVEVQDLYLSDYFEKKRRWAEENTIGWWVLSAKFGALPSRSKKHTYDRHIDDVPDDVYRRKVRLKLRACDLKWLGETKVYVLAGQRYINPIRGVLDDLPAEVVYPFEDTKGIGEQQAWLTDELDHSEPSGTEEVTLDAFA